MNILSRQLASARADASMLDPDVASESVRSPADAYLIQDELAAIYGGDVRGWKVTALTAEQERGYRTDKPVAGALFARFVHVTPGDLAQTRGRYGYRRLHRRPSGLRMA
jgi:2-keto-4-pentenoate hydratase